jgi:8-oxoguanine deaminase
MLIRNSLGIMTGLPGERARAAGPDLRITEEGRIGAIGQLQPLQGERVVDATDCVIYPGWINTHHHLAQTVLTGIPEGLNLPLMGWLAAVAYRYRRRFDRELLSIATELGLAQLLLSGCTTIADHHNLYWPGMGYDPAEVLFGMAERFGVRFAFCRGGATVPGRWENDPPPPETVDGIVADVERMVRAWHDPGPEAMRRVVMAPSTPTFSVKPEELKPLARAGRQLGVRLHAHLSETADYVQFCRDKFGRKPVEFVAEHDWLGEDVWFAHMVHVSPSEIRLVGETRTGIAHCAASNCRLGSGIAPAPELAAAGAPVSLGVDGSACNEPGDSISEAHTCWYTHRAVRGAGALSVEDVIRWGTRGGAQVLGIDNIGALEPGRAADLAVYDLAELRYAGMHDPLVGPVASGGKPKLRLATVQGRVVVENDAIPDLDLPRLLARSREAVARLKSVV